MSAGIIPKRIDDLAGEPPVWLKAPGWLALFALLAGAALPRTVAWLNVGAAVGGAVLVIARLRRRPELRLPKWVGWGLLAFAASVGFSVAKVWLTAPAGSIEPEWALHALGHTARALIAVGLCLLLLRTQRDWAALLGLVTLLLLVVSAWAPFHYWITEAPAGLRMTGARGFPNRFAIELYLLGFLPWILLLTPELRLAALPGWAVKLGYGVAVVLPLALLRKKLATGATDNETALNLVVAGVVLAGLLAWRLWTRRPGWRFGLAALALALGFCDVALTNTRLKFLMMIATAAAAFLIAGRRARTALPFLAVLVRAGLGIMMFNPRTLQTESMRHRMYIWQGTLNVLRDHWLWGTGYGNEIFDARWHPLRPQAADFGLSSMPDSFLRHCSHAHNLWLELLAERGVLGLIAFHLLWLGTLGELIGAARRTQRPQTLAIGSADLPNEAWGLRGAVALPAVCLALMAPEGLLTYSLRLSDEMLYWFVAGLGLAATRLAAAEAPASDLASND